MGDPRSATDPLAERRARFAREFDHVRRFAVNEPRGHDAIVGALLCEPHDKSCAAGVIYFNNVGYIGMCGHGTIGLAVTLAHIGRLKPGRHRFETPVGVVGVELIDGCTATVENVESYRLAEAVEVEVAGSRNRARRRRLGRQLVLPHFVCALRPRVRERGSADRSRDCYQRALKPKACAAKTAP